MGFSREQDFMSKSFVVSDSAPWILFDDCDAPDRSARGVLLDDPLDIVETSRLSDLPQALERLQRSIDSGLHAAGFFSYEAGYGLEPCLRKLLPEERSLPLMWFALFTRPKHLTGADYENFLEQAGTGQPDGRLLNIRPDRSKKDYLRGFEKVKQFIAAGDLYQANLAMRLLFEHQGVPFLLYRKLREKQPVRYGCFLHAPRFSLLSVSPELFFEVSDGILTTRPMKGTARRGKTDEEDRALSESLRNDEKNRAENLMIVDLMRNDLSRLCQPGTVKVGDLYRVERYPSLFQMTSQVTGRLKPELSVYELFRALFPAGSITGAPKIRAMQLISQLEEQPRGAYCGAMGILSRDRSTGQLRARFNVAIRTLTLWPDGRGETFVGSGIVQDSRGEDEYRECLLKAKFLDVNDFQLIETMRLDGAGFYLRQRHMQRLARSCKTLGFFFPAKKIEQALDRLQEAHKNSSQTRLVRLLLFVGGAFTLSERVIKAPDPAKLIRFVMSSKGVEQNNELLRHKTTRRQLFNEEWQRAQDDHGADEVLFFNERGECTEGSRSSLFVERNGRLLTPPVSCGLLPGTLREELLDKGRAVEAVLRRADLENAKIWFGNSVRGLQPAQLVEAREEIAGPGR